MNCNLYLIVPAYNEQQNIAQFVNDWYPIVDNIPNSQLVIINDGSTDETLRVLQSLAPDKPKLRVLTKTNGGHGDTLLYGYRYAIDNDADWIFQTDSDGQTKADEFHYFWRQRNHYDAIFGNRKNRGDGMSRLFVEKTLCMLLWIIFGVKVPDANCPYRLMRANKVRDYLEYLPEHYSLPNVMMTVYFIYNKDKALFKEITFENRKNGINSINLHKIIKIGIRSIKDFLRFKQGIKSI